ncbi:hypothetical protein L1887_51403 [Cichorium endivia]|nr:hypothetical protein L1887_51403 [Cichorium endivia]
MRSQKRAAAAAGRSAPCEPKLGLQGQWIGASAFGWRLGRPALQTECASAPRQMTGPPPPPPAARFSRSLSAAFRRKLMLCANRKSIRILESSTHSQSPHLPTIAGLGKSRFARLQRHGDLSDRFSTMPLHAPPSAPLSALLTRRCALSFRKSAFASTAIRPSQLQIGMKPRPDPSDPPDPSALAVPVPPLGMSQRKLGGALVNELEPAVPGRIEARVGALEHPLAIPAFSNTPIDSRFSGAIWQRELPAHTRGEEAVACCACSSRPEVNPAGGAAFALPLPKGQRVESKRRGVGPAFSSWHESKETWTGCAWSGRSACRSAASLPRLGILDWNADALSQSVAPSPHSRPSSQSSRTSSQNCPTIPARNQVARAPPNPQRHHPLGPSPSCPFSPTQNTRPLHKPLLASPPSRAPLSSLSPHPRLARCTSKHGNLGISLGFVSIS